MARFEHQDLTEAEFRECDLTRARLIGVVMQDAVIDGRESSRTPGIRHQSGPGPRISPCPAVSTGVLAPRATTAGLRIPVVPSADP